MDNSTKHLENLIKFAAIIGTVSMLIMLVVFARTESFGKRIVTIENCVKTQEYDGLKLKADEIIGWNIEKGLSTVEIFEEWKSKEWVSSIAELTYCLSKDIGREILVGHFGEGEIIKLEQAMGLAE